MPYKDPETRRLKAREYTRRWKQRHPEYVQAATAARTESKRAGYLALVASGPCAGHLCDDCHICRRGICCRRDSPNYRLPTEGDWPGPVYGAIGQLERQGGGVVCHACGETHGILSGHLYWRHNLTADEYKAIFGLNVTTGLVSEVVHNRLSLIDRSEAQLEQWARFAVGEIYPTPEQRSSRPSRRRESMPGLVACLECGSEFHRRGGRNNRYCSIQCRSKHMVRFNPPVIGPKAWGPEARTKRRRKIRAQSWTEFICEECGARFSHPKFRPPRFCDNRCRLMWLERHMAQRRAS